MKLSTLIQDYYSNLGGELNVKLDKNIKHLAFKLDDIQENTLYFCLKTKPEEIDIYTAKAKELGAVAVVSQEITKNAIIQIKVPSVRKALALFSAKFYGNPANHLKMIGITGTNGKTTSTYILKSILEADNHKVGLIGTNGYMIGNSHYPLNMTTPDPIELNQTLAKMLKHGCQYVVMEVSAHALYFDKIDGMTFECGVFTNCTQDHLDFFKTFNDYALAKSKFFNPKYLKSAVINIDDNLGQKLYQNISIKCLSYGLKIGNVFSSSIDASLDGSTFIVHNKNKTEKVQFAIPGEYNIQNVLGCVACARQLGIDMNTIKQGIENVSHVKGRFEVHKTPKNSYAIVDYAHTPDGVENVLKSVRKLTKGKIITVFGCGGNRDTTKRPIMGEIAGKYSDFCVVTSDNPRYENPFDIIAQVEKGVKSTTKEYICMENRKNAIEYALDSSSAGDCVLILGKGAENYQEIQGIKNYFSDKEIVLDWCHKKKNKYNITCEK